jgi:hypothetical protein
MNISTFGNQVIILPDQNIFVSLSAPAILQSRKQLKQAQTPTGITYHISSLQEVTIASLKYLT